SSYVRPNEDIETAVGQVARRLEAPVMTDVVIAFQFDEKPKPERGKPVSRIYPRGKLDLFAGEQLVLVGRYKKAGKVKVAITGRVEGEEQRLAFPARLVRKSNDDSQAFIEKLWAVRRVGEIIDQLDLEGENEELVEELVKLSKRHGILTPYTSFMADETTRLDDLAGQRRRAVRRLHRGLAQTSGASGVLQRRLKGGLQRATRFDFRAPAAEAADAMDAAAAPAATGAARPSPGQIAGRPGGAGQAAPRAPGTVSGELQQAEETIRQVGNRTFYRRDGQWIDSRLTEKQQEDPERVKQFSDRYFELARKHGRELSQYLAFDEPVLLEVEGRAYLIEP
ncbi:MAG: hypothetical protein ACOC46_02475, partial [Pirellulales bacterium]